MKRKLLFILLLSSIFDTTIYAQNAVYEVPITSMQSIVRNYRPDQQWVIFNIDLNWGKQFMLTDLTSTQVVALPYDYRVLDFEIYNDFVIFCGVYRGVQGFLGWFNIQDLFYGGGAFHIDETTLIQEQFLSLENIEVYGESADVYVVGYGKDLNTSSYIAFEAKGATLNNLSYRAKPLVCDEIVNDIAVTDKYVVIASTMINHNYQVNTPCGVCLDVYPKTNVLGLAVDQQYLFQTHIATGPLSPTSPTGSEPYNNQLLITHKRGDLIAMASYNKTRIPSEESFWIKTIDISSGSFVGNFLSTPMDISSAELRGFHYNSLAQSYVSLHHNVAYAGNPFEMVIPTSSTLVPPFAINGDGYGRGVELYNLDIDGPSKYLAIGWDQQHVMNLFRGSITNVQNCANNISYRCEEINPISNKPPLCRAKASPWYPMKMLDVFPEPKMHLSNQIICQ